MKQFNGSKLIGSNTTEVTDAATTSIVTANVNDYANILIDVVSDKGGTIDVVRFLDEADGVEGVPATQQTLADGGPSDYYQHSAIGCNVVRVTFTKTEAGTSSGFGLFVRGQDV